MGPEVMTGEQMRSLTLADEIDLAIACESFTPRPGQKYGRTLVESASVIHGAVKRPDAATTGRCQSSSKFRVYAAATSADAIVKLTFSSRVKESLVQFIEPLNTAACGLPTSRTT